MHTVWLVMDRWNDDDWNLWVAGVYDSEQGARAFIDTFGPHGRYELVQAPLNPALGDDWRTEAYAARTERAKALLAS